VRDGAVRDRVATVRRVPGVSVVIGVRVAG
jgi:hypothetical protein